VVDSLPARIPLLASAEARVADAPVRFAAFVRVVEQREVVFSPAVTCQAKV
jgi:hypothetical protein